MTFHQPGKGNQNKAKLQQLPFDKSEPSRIRIPSLQGKHCPFLFFFFLNTHPLGSQPPARLHPGRTVEFCSIISAREQQEKY